jgi:cadmium resistance protein CadD (predicted permease)
MDNIFIEIGVAILTFTLTNIDDLFLLSIYFSNPSYKTENIVGGQFLGIFTLIGISLVGALAGKAIDDRWIGLLGIVPVLIGIKELIYFFKNKNKPKVNVSQSGGVGFLGIALITLSNGSDNIGVYTPLFANSSNYQCSIYLIIFAFLTAFWCFLGYVFVSLPSIKSQLSKVSQWLLPVFLIALGLTILYESKLFN